ncbi:MAG: type II toxin-antitoxin system HicA family toxin [Treponema sp.]|nr:type II toxin-antitoxin system HicA family toxin [Treponema sp.]
MSKKDKLIARLKSRPKDFTFDEAKTLLEIFGYCISNAGKTSGSRVCFTRGQKVFRMHKPHPRKELLLYQVRELTDELEGEDLI